MDFDLAGLKIILAYQDIYNCFLFVPEIIRI